MIWKALQSTIIFLVVILGFLLILLLPKEMEITHVTGLKYEAEYPFNMTLYQQNIEAFITHFKEERGFGTTPGGSPLVEEMFRFLKRSLKIIMPAFLLAMTIGTVIGMLLFRIRKTSVGRVVSLIASLLASVPDFFLFIAIQYVIIMAMKYGFPSFHLYSSDDWYSFLLPCLSLTIFPLFHMVKVTMVAMEDEVSEDYVRTALSKGMKEQRVMSHMFWNGFSTMVNQAQTVMLYIVSSLPIIEKLSNYKGAGAQLLDSVFAYDHVRALLFFLPFLLLMYIIVMFAQIARAWFLPEDVRKA